MALGFVDVEVEVDVDESERIPLQLTGLVGLPRKSCFNY